MLITAKRGVQYRGPRVCFMYLTRAGWVIVANAAVILPLEDDMLT